MIKAVFFFFTSFFVFNSLAEDIELYIGDNTQRAGGRAQVLVIFDTSGSMKTSETIRPRYNPATDYDGSADDDYIYFSRDSNVPKEGSSYKFLASKNGCASSIPALNSAGKYTGFVMKYVSVLSWNYWDELRNWYYLSHVDCLDDINTSNQGNAIGFADGYPATGTGYPGYADNTDNTPQFSRAVTLYSANYINWYANAPLGTSRTRLQIAQETVSNLIESAPGVTFGVAAFNGNQGGRITYGIKDETSYDSKDLTDQIKNFVADGSTPLCETLYEAALYFGGKDVEFGNITDRTPAKDPIVTGDPVDADGNVTKVNKTYISPYSGCSNEIYVILMTDGQPQSDSDANQLIEDLTGNENATDNRLDELAYWMHNNDINPTMDETQIATIYTIGFGEDATSSAGQLLTDTANKGGGKYYPTDEPSELLQSLQAALLEILNISTSFTSPSVASNNFDRTETLDSIYYAMFLPSEGARWQGNLKKLKVEGDKLLDRDGNDAIKDEDSIVISQDAKTFWSTDSDPDGGDVRKGGAAEMLRNKTNRVIYGDIDGDGSAIDLLNQYSAEAYYGSKADFASALGVDENDVYSYFNWALGHDIDDVDGDSNTNEMRPDVFADPLHSKPLVINYGGATEDSQDVRILVGTNAGVLHFFDDNGDTVDESWAFMPKEFFSNIAKFRNNSSNSKIYGIDGAPTSYIYDKNGDGQIKKVDGDSALVFFGLRRGGSSYYGLDVTNPSKPILLWKIDENTDGFAEMGQSWSKPTVGYSSFNIENGRPKPVVIFGGGYDENKDSLEVGTPDTDGKAVYMVDAYNGQLKWSLSPTLPSNINTQFKGTDSIPSSIATLDSNSDGLIDRLYFGDTGGNVWRVDMPNSLTRPGDATVFKLAELGGTTNATDRRFFSAPAVARTYFTDTTETTVIVNGVSDTTITRQLKAYDAVLIGSGDDPTPSNKDTSDMMFMIKDDAVISQRFAADATAIPAAITLDGLYDISGNKFDSFTNDNDRKAEEVLLTEKSGWYHDYSGEGEKTTASAIIINGVATYVTYLPASDTVALDSCQLNEGVSKTYTVGLEYAMTQANTVRVQTTVGPPLDTPTIIITKDQCTTNCTPCTGPSCPTDPATIKVVRGTDIDGVTNSDTTERTYLYITED